MFLPWLSVSKCKLTKNCFLFKHSLILSEKVNCVEKKFSCVFLLARPLLKNLFYRINTIWFFPKNVYLFYYIMKSSFFQVRFFTTRSTIKTAYRLTIFITLPLSPLINGQRRNPFNFLYIPAVRFLTLPYFYDTTKTLSNRFDKKSLTLSLAIYKRTFYSAVF